MSALKKFLIVGVACLFISAIEIPGLEFALPMDMKVVKDAKIGGVSRYHPILGPRRSIPHLFLLADEGEQVGAVELGEVVTSEYHKYKGNWVAILHNDSITSEYWHLSELKVTQGQLVNKGQLVGLVGNTGLSTEPHLALYMKSNGTLLWPCAILPCQLLP